MRAMVVVVVPPAVELADLRGKVGGGFLRDLGLEDPVHLLMGVVVDAAGAVHELDADAEAMPPEAEPGEIERADAAKRHAAVRADGPGMAMEPE